MKKDNGENGVQSLIELTDQTVTEIRSMGNTVAFITLLDDKKMLQEVEATGSILTVIRQSVQSGNVRRAYKYFMALKKVQRDMSEVAEHVRMKVNDRILGK